MGPEACIDYHREIIAESPWDIQVIVHGETFPAKKFKENRRPISGDCSFSRDIGGCIEVGDWLTERQKIELKNLMSFPDENPSTVFQIMVNVQPMRRLICEWAHANVSDVEDKYYFTQLADLDK